MINLNNLNKQHGRIKEEVNYLDAEINKGSLAMNVTELALHINKLAGQLRMHLLEEDKFLYPNLLKCSDADIQKLAQQYIKEMGNLVSEFTDFKNKYNISSKIIANKDKFLEDIQNIIKGLKDRITKEDNELYYLIQLKKL